MMPEELVLNLISMLSGSWRSSAQLTIREYLVLLNLAITQEDQQGTAVEKMVVHVIENNRSVKAPQVSRTGPREDVQGGGYL